MLGYVRADTDELRVREQRFYRALYCGLCKRMGKCTGNCSRMTLSYDFVFLAAIRLSLTGEIPTLKKQRCLIHPLRARPTAQKCDALDYAADASALLVYHKLLDDLHDERGLKRARAILSRPFLASAYRRAKRRHPALDQTISAHLHKLSELEADARVISADALAEQFGLLMGEVFCTELEHSNERIARTIGRAVGRWIYLADAADDFEEDRKRNRPNPYLHLFGETPTASDWSNLGLALTAQLCDAERGFLLIDAYPTPELREILSNIFYLGLPKTAAQILQKNAAPSAEVTEQA